MEPIKAMQMGNIIRVEPVDLSEGDYTDENGFFIRSGSGGTIKYCPMNNADNEYIIKEIEASAIFDDPEICRKVFADATSPAAGDLFAGYGV